LIKCKRKSIAVVAKNLKRKGAAVPKLFTPSFSATP